MAKKQELKDPLTVAEATRRYDVSRKFIKRRVEDGRIRSVKVGQYILVEHEDVKREVNDSRLDPAGQAMLAKALESSRRARGK